MSKPSCVVPQSEGASSILTRRGAGNGGSGKMRPLPGRRRPAGFALPAVLAVTGVVTLIFLVAITALANLTREAATARARMSFMQAALTAEAQMAYLLSTEPVATRSVRVGAPRNMDSLEETLASGGGSGLAESEVLIDGEPYVFASPTPLVISLQDAAGLINLSLLGPDDWRRLFEKAGVSAGDAAGVPARYADYIDQDSLRQPNGAEQESYPGGGPPNRPLRRPTELLSVLGVRDAVDVRRWRVLRHQLTYEPFNSGLNINTATPEMLQVMFGLTPAQSATVVRTRRTAPFISGGDFTAISGGPVIDDIDRSYFAPNGRYHFVIRDTRSGWIYRGRMQTNPFSLEQPVWIDQTELHEAPRRAPAETTDVDRFPYAPY